MRKGLLLIILTMCFSPISVAADKPNLLVMGEDSDPDTVPRNSRVYTRVVNTVVNQLNDVGFDVYDETAVTNGNFAQGRTRRTDAELFGIAQSIQNPPIDVAVVFTIYASIIDKEYINKVQARVTGRLLQVKTGKRLGNFEMKAPRSWTAPANCNRECVLETVGEYSKILAQDVGAVLAEKLAWLVDGDNGDPLVGGSQLSSGFTILIDNFTPEQVMNMEEYLKIFSGYESHRPISSTPRRSEIWYQSTIASAKLNSNLKKMLKALELNGSVLFSGNTYIIRKTKAVKKIKPVDGDW